MLSPEEKEFLTVKRGAPDMYYPSGKPAEERVWVERDSTIDVSAGVWPSVQNFFKDISNTLFTNMEKPNALASPLRGLYLQLRAKVWCPDTTLYFADSNNLIAKSIMMVHQGLRIEPKVISKSYPTIPFDSIPAGNSLTMDAGSSVASSAPVSLNLIRSGRGTAGEYFPIRWRMYPENRFEVNSIAPTPGFTTTAILRIKIAISGWEIHPNM